MEKECGMEESGYTEGRIKRRIGTRKGLQMGFGSYSCPMSIVIDSNSDHAESNVRAFRVQNGPPMADPKPAQVLLWAVDAAVQKVITCGSAHRAWRLYL